MSQPLNKLQDSIRITRAGMDAYGSKCFDDGVPEVAHIALGTHVTAVLTTQGKVFTAGNNSYGQLGRGTQGHGRHGLQEVPLPGAAKDVSCSAEHLLVCLVDGRVAACGANYFAQCGNRAASIWTPSIVPSTAAAVVERVRNVFAGSWYSFVLCYGGEVISFGRNSAGQLGLGAVSKSELPQRSEALSGKGVRQICTGAEHGLALLEDGGVLAWGRLNGWCPTRGGCVIRLSFGGHPSGNSLTAVSASAGGRHCAVVTGDGVLWLWGADASCSRPEAFGNPRGDVVRDTPEPQQVDLPGGRRAAHVQCGELFTLVRAADGLFFSRGDPANGITQSYSRNPTPLLQVPLHCFGRSDPEDDEPCRCNVATGPSARHALFIRFSSPGVLRVGDVTLNESALDQPLSDLGVTAESTVHLLRVPRRTAAGLTVAGCSGLQVYVNAAALGIEYPLCVELHPDATARDVVCAAAEILKRTNA
eukprot:TRINITY_DN10744_c0_g1_i1.p1 TRINITY_DN10744_c0_g1~~TRINITY_DN10744_c0_g1_i1.p1  ORF type:complete len:501 (+),score=114.64 TRINITY_DN10744_c0_g1_i1:81-1505(+)